MTTKTFLRVHKVEVTDAGTGNTNAGIITATYTTAATVEATLVAGSGISRNSHFTVPAKTSLLIVKTNVNIAKSVTGTAAGLVDVTRYTRSPGKSFVQGESTRLDILIQNYAVWGSDLTVLIPEKTDTVLRAQTSTGGIFIRCTQYGILFEPN